MNQKCSDELLPPQSLSKISYDYQSWTIIFCFPVVENFFLCETIAYNWCYGVFSDCFPSSKIKFNQTSIWLLEALWRDHACRRQVSPTKSCLEKQTSFNGWEFGPHVNLVLTTYTLTEGCKSLLVLTHLQGATTVLHCSLWIIFYNKE